VTRASTLLIFNTCTSPASNVDGYLSCNRGPQTPPPGSYTQTCTNPTFDGTSLTAQCEREDGTLANPSSIPNVANCSSISNQHGILSCDCSPKIAASLSGKTNVTLTVTGNCFLPNHSITIQATDNTANSPTQGQSVPPRQPTATSDASGAFSAQFSFICKGINIKVSATDGRANPQASYNVLWSNNISLTCP